MALTSTSPLPGSPCASSGSTGELSRELYAAALLDTMVACRRAAEQQEANLLALAVDYVTLHPATDLIGPDDPTDPPADEAEKTADEADGPVGAVWATAGLTGHRPDAWCPLAGPGTPSLSVEAVAALGAALTIGYHSAMRLCADAVELAVRLPLLWTLVQDGHLAAWKARQVTAHTATLSAPVVDFIDRHLAHLAARGQTPPPGQLRSLVHEALLAVDPDTAAGREDAALRNRDVTFDHRDSTATSTLTATMDTLDALDLDATITDLATEMATLGDTDPLGVRRAHALGTLAHPQRTLDLFGDPRPATLTDSTFSTDELAGRGSDALATGSPGPSTRAPGKPASRSSAPWNPAPWNSTTAILHLHITAADLRSHTGGGTVEKLGPATLDLLRDWLRRADRVTIRPVLNLSSGVGHPPSVDQHDPPDRIRQAVILRDGHCVFPGCSIEARSCDLDHIVPYVPLDQGGPPGQTSVDSLACLCRRHHRLKTFSGWHYERSAIGRYTWTSPTARSYTTRSQPITPPRRC